MDVLLLGAAAVVLIALTVWIVWRPAEAASGAVRVEEASTMLPQGDEFEDQYTSATADLSAGGIAVTTSGTAEEPRLADAEPSLTEYQTAGEPWSQPSLAHEGAVSGPPAAAAPRIGATTPPVTGEPVERATADRAPTIAMPPRRTIGLGAAALLTLGGAAAGAWLYARWQQERQRPLNRLRRRFR